jgi:hypothetical protein
MATWKKILVSGSSIEAASITGSAGLNLPFSNAGFILTTDANGNISETDPATITGADQSFSIRGDNDGGVNITFDTGDTLLFDTASAHGFSFDVTDDLGGTTGLTSVRLSTPQDLTTTGDVRFNSASLDSEGIVFANSGTPTKTQIKLGTSLISLNVEDAGAAQIEALKVEPTVVTINNSAEVTDFQVKSTASFGPDDSTRSHLFFVNVHDTDNAYYSASVLIGGTAASDVDNSNLLTISGSTMIKGALSASAVPTASSTATDLLIYNPVSKGFETAQGLGNFGTEISASIGAMTASLSSSIGDVIAGTTQSISDIVDDITAIHTTTGSLVASASRGIRFQEGAGAQTDGGTISLGNTASFIGTANEITVTHDGATAGEEKFTFSLPSKVDLGSNSELTVTNITASNNISASGNITASNLFASNDIVLGGTLAFLGGTFIENETLSISGSTVFGSSSAENTHTFTGSLLITGGATFDGLGASVTIGQDLTVNGSTTLGNGAADIIDITGNVTASNNITAGGNISASGNLFGDLTEGSYSNVVVYDDTDGRLYVTASSAIGTTTMSIGPAGDGTYDDGLLDFDNDTPVGTAVDEINEILLALAPAKAPLFNHISVLRSGSPADFDGTTGSDIFPDLTANSVELSFGAGNSNTNGYTLAAGTDSLTTLGAGTNSSVALNGTFTGIAEPTSFTDGGAAITTDERFGIISSSDTTPNHITGSLNAFELPNPTDTGTNHGMHAFRDGDKGMLKLYVNNELTPHATLSLDPGEYNANEATSDAVNRAVNISGSGFIEVSATMSANFPSGTPFETFKHRSGSFVIHNDSMVPGWNWARVIHSSSTNAFERKSNYIEWIYEPSGSVKASWSNESIRVKSRSGTQYISQIPYYTTVEVEYTASVANAYTMTYVGGTAITTNDDNNTLSGFDVTSNLRDLTTSEDPKDVVLEISSSANIDDSNTLYFFTSSENGGTGTNAVGDGAGKNEFTGSVATSLTCKRPFAANATSNILRTGSFFFYGKNLTNTTTAGNYDYKFAEDDGSGRLISSSFEDQNSVSAGASAWNQQTTGVVANNGMIIYGQPQKNGDISSTADQDNFNRIISPNSTALSYNGGNFTDFSTPGNGPASFPNFATGYSNFSPHENNSNIRSCFLQYQNGTSGTPTLNVVLKGINATVVPATTALSGNNIHVLFKIPGVTGFRDLGTSNPPEGGYNQFDSELGDAAGNGGLTNNVGCHDGDLPSDMSLGSTNDSLSLGVQLVSQELGANQYAVLAILCHQDWNGYIYNVTIS